ncbi:MAG: hypothetical protein ACP5JG_05830 [Anaerolineae bacterium]
MISERPTPQRRVYVALLACYILLVAAYVNGRFAWRGLYDDAIRLTQLSENVYAEGTLLPTGGAYSFGYAYPALNTVLAHVTGIPVEALQHFAQPFLAIVLLPLSYVAFRGLTGSDAIAGLGTLLLFLQPEFLFEALRSSHAKVTWAMALLMLFLLTRGFCSQGRRHRAIVAVPLFYLVAFALIASSSFFASTYIFGIGLVFVGARLLGRLRRTNAPVVAQLSRLWLVAVACMVLVFVFIFYIYPPARAQLSSLKRELDRLSVLLLGAEPTEPLVNPYVHVSGTWINGQAYLLVSCANWLVLLLSFGRWIYLGRQQWLRRWTLGPGELLLWLLYAAFSFMLATAVLFDVLGLLSANLQVRLFAHLVIFAVPLAAQTLAAFVKTSCGWPPAAHRALWGMLSLACALLVVGSLLKITNEPLLSNGWTFYVPEERAAVEWVGAHVRTNGVWLGYDRRLSSLAEWCGGWQKQHVRTVRGKVPTTARYALLSSLLEGQALRRGEVLPNVHSQHRVYHNGEAGLFYSRPVTPFQR